MERFQHQPRVRRLGAGTAAVLAGAGLLVVGGCGEKKEEPAQPAPTAPAEPRDSTSSGRAAPQDEPAFAVEPEPVEPLDVPAGVEFPEDRRPSDRSLAESIVQAASALLASDSAALASMLDDTARQAFETLQMHSLASAAFEDIARIRVCAVDERAEEASVALGVQRARHATLLTLRAAKRGEGWVFQGLTPMATAIADSVEAFDGVQLAEAPLPEPLPEEIAPTEEAEEQQPQRPRRTGPIGGIL